MGGNILNDLLGEIEHLQGPEIDDNFFDLLLKNISWDDRIKSRRTASFGVPYNYSEISYPFKPIPSFLTSLMDFVFRKVGFLPNNCLINYYPDPDSKMGFHSDDTQILTEGTGVAIFSFGNSRILRFKNKLRRDFIEDVELENGSFFYMSQKVQKTWMHAILPCKEKNHKSSRISISFRHLK